VHSAICASGTVVFGVVVLGVVRDLDALCAAPHAERARHMAITHNAEVGMTQVMPISAQLGLHALLREDQERTVLAKAQDDLEADAGEAGRGQRPTPATHASPDTGTRALAGKRGARAPRLLRRAWQHRRSSGLPHSGDPALVQGATASKPEKPSQLGTDEPHRDPVAPACPCAASLPECALRRQDPRQEPSAVVPHAGICTGGRPQGRSLP